MGWKRVYDLKIYTFQQLIQFTMKQSATLTPTFSPLLFLAICPAFTKNSYCQQISKFLDHLSTRNFMYKRRNFLSKSKVLSSWGHKASWQSQPQKIQNSQQVTALILLHTSTQERISSLRHFGCILVEKKFLKSYLNIWAQFPENLLQVPFHATLFSASHNLPKNQSYHSPHYNHA